MTMLSLFTCIHDPYLIQYFPSNLKAKIRCYYNPARNCTVPECFQNVPAGVKDIARRLVTFFKVLGNVIWRTFTEHSRHSLNFQGTIFYLEILCSQNVLSTSPPVLRTSPGNIPRTFRDVEHDVKFF